MLAMETGLLTSEPKRSGGLEWIAGCRILIVNNQFDGFTGSEVHCLELADFFKAHGAKVSVVGLRRDAEFCAALKNRHRIHGRRAMIGQGFDLIWTHQETSFLLVHGILGMRSKLAVHGLLSSYLEHEQIPQNDDFDRSRLIYLANSVETQRAAEVRAADIETTVLRNIVPEAFRVHAKRDHSPSLRKLAIVSNHVPVELLGAVEVLENKGIDVTIFGKSHVFVPITETTLTGFDAVVTIGKTAQYCLVQGIPLYLYDHFGGPGYFTATELEQHESANFSGRSEPTKRSAEEISDQVMKGYDRAVRDAVEMAKDAPERYLLSFQLARLISFSDDRQQRVFSRSARFAMVWQTLTKRPRTVLRVIAPKMAERIARARNPVT